MVDPRRQRRGNLIVTGASASVLLAFAAVVVDVSYLRVIDVQLTQAVRAASLAGAGQLDGTRDGINAATSAAVTVGNMNAVMGGTDLVGSSEVILHTYQIHSKTVYS